MEGEKNTHTGIGKNMYMEENTNKNKKIANEMNLQEEMRPLWFFLLYPSAPLSPSNQIKQKKFKLSPETTDLKINQLLRIKTKYPRKGK